MAQRAAAERARVRGGRRQVLLRAVRQGRRAVVHLPGDRGHRDARQVHGARPPQDAQRVLPAEPGRARRGHVPARGARAGRRSQEAPDRHRAVHPQGAHPQGAGGARSGTPTTGTRAARTSTSTSSSRRRTPRPALAAFRTGQSRLHLAREPVRGGDVCARPTPTPSCSRTTTRWRRSAWRWPRTSRPSTTCACGGRSRWPSTARSRWTRSSRVTASSAGACRTSTIRTRRRRREGLRPVVAVQAGRGEEAPGRGRPRQGLRDDAVLLRVLPADDLAGPARPAGSQEEPQHRRQDHQARLHDLLRPLRREQVGRDVVGVPVGPRDRASTSGRTSTCTPSPRRTSSASTIRSSTS